MQSEAPELSFHTHVRRGVSVTSSLSVAEWAQTFVDAQQLNFGHEIACFVQQAQL